MNTVVIIGFAVIVLSAIYVVWKMNCLSESLNDANVRIAKLALQQKMDKRDHNLRHPKSEVECVDEGNGDDDNDLNEIDSESKASVMNEASHTSYDKASELGDLDENREVVPDVVQQTVTSTSPVEKTSEDCEEDDCEYEDDCEFDGEEGLPPSDHSDSIGDDNETVPTDCEELDLDVPLDGVSREEPEFEHGSGSVESELPAYVDTSIDVEISHPPLETNVEPPRIVDITETSPPAKKTRGKRKK